LIVIDSSYTLALVMPDESRPLSRDEVLARRLTTPAIWPLEIANALRSSVRRRRVQPAEIDALCWKLDGLKVDVMQPTHISPKRHFDAAQAHDLTPYDAMYLELALQLRSGLATRDATLAAAAHRFNLPVYG
jgi:predicted nucleic acid-binding protein